MNIIEVLIIFQQKIKISDFLNTPFYFSLSFFVSDI